jgi:hypothetical protein
MKKMNLYILLSLTLGVLSFPLEGASNAQPANMNTKNAPSSARQATTVNADEEYYNILKRDQIDNTDVLAIPLDDSEIEDEEEIDRAERNNTFPLPHPR